jgi:hypothetical protein
MTYLRHVVVVIILVISIDSFRFSVDFNQQKLQFGRVKKLILSQSISPEVSLEAEPYWNTAHAPLHHYQHINPCPAVVTEVRKLVSGRDNGEVIQVNVDHGGKFYFWEGQSCGVIPPGMLVDSVLIE